MVTVYFTFEILTTKRKIDEVQIPQVIESSAKKSKKSYTIEFKLELIEKAKSSSNLNVARIFQIDEKLVRTWRKDECKLRSSIETGKSQSKA